MAPGNWRRMGDQELGEAWANLVCVVAGIAALALLAHYVAGAS